MINEEHPRKCMCNDCDIVLELELSLLIGICRWCRRELEHDWDDTDWFDDYQKDLDWGLEE